MLTMRPNLRAIMPSTVALMSSIGVSMLASIARIHASRSQSRKSPGGGPPALVTRMSGSGHAASAAARPSGVVMSHATSRAGRRRSPRAVCASVASVRATIVTSTPSRASASRAAASQSLARRAHQRAASGDAEIHRLFLMRRARSARRTRTTVPTRKRQQHRDDVEHLAAQCRGRA